MGSEPKQEPPPDSCFTSFTKLVWLLSVCLVAALLTSCGSGGGGTGAGTSPPAPGPDFNLSVAPSNTYLQTGTAASMSLSASGSNGFSSSIAVNVSGVPAGVTVSPTAIAVSPGTPQVVTFSASASASIANATVTFAGTSGSLSHSVDAKLAVIQPITSNAPPFRMRYVRTDAATLYMAWLNSSWIIYNPPTNRFFVTDPYGNRVYALDAGTETVVGSISVPGAFGIGDTPDHSTLYVGTQIGDVYAINPATMTVTKRYVASQIGPKGFHAFSVRVMADGRLALLGGQGGIPGVDGYGDFAIWNPADNSISLYASQYGAGYSGLSSGAYTQVCGPLLNIGVFTRTPDRSKVVIASIDSDGTLCEVDESTGTDQYAGDPANGFIWHLAISPDGNLIVLPYGPNGTNQVVALDMHTLAQVSLINVVGDTSGAADLFIGPDSKTLYMSASFSATNLGGIANMVYAYDLTNGNLLGWLPNIWVPPVFIGVVSAYGPIDGPQFEAMDGTGLLAGPTQEGVGFLDTTELRSGPVGTQFTTGSGLPNPGTGPTDGGTATSWGAWPATQVELSGVYFGSQQAPSASAAGGSNGATISATTPPGAPGPADIYALSADGGVQMIPDGFSYGPTVLEVTPNMAITNTSGPSIYAYHAAGTIYGYGFGPANSSSAPSDLQITVGGQAATITAFNPNAYGLQYPPFALQSVSYNIPQGTSGTADVAVATSSGTAAAIGGMTYLPPIKLHPLTGGALAQGIYDPYNDLYYFTDATQIRVFSKINGEWLPSITIPPADNPQRLWGLALSPNGNELAVSDVQGQAIYVLSPANASAVQKFAVPQPGAGVITNPVGVAISNNGVVYFTASSYGGSGYSGFFQLDTNNGSVTSYCVDGPGLTSDIYLRAALSPANSHVYFNDDGEVFSVDTGTGAITYEQTEPGCCYGDDDLALSSDQTRLAATGYFYDSSLNADSTESPNIREAMNISYLYGEKLSPDGRLLFQPTTIGIDVLDGKLGNLLDRIALPVTLSPNYDALVSDGKDNDLIAITGASGDGIAEIDLTSIPEPAPLPYSPSTASSTRSATFKTYPPVRSAGQGQASKKKHSLLRRQRIPHKAVHNLLQRFPQGPVPPE